MKKMSKKCKGCSPQREGVKLRECRNCQTPGFCKDCPRCDNCKVSEPGWHQCWASGRLQKKHDIPVGGKRANCVDCKSPDYCATCLVQCPCGQGGQHYLCFDRMDEWEDSVSHICQWRDPDSGIKGCNKMCCRQYCSVRNPVEGDQTMLVCNEHRPEVVKRLAEILAEEIDRLPTESARKKTRLDSIKKFA